MLKKFMKSFMVARTASALATLTDRQLADIGIDRKGIRERAEFING